MTTSEGGKAFAEIVPTLRDEFQVVVGKFKGPWGSKAGAQEDADDINSEFENAVSAAVREAYERAAKTAEDHHCSHLCADRGMGVSCEFKIAEDIRTLSKGPSK